MTKVSLSEEATTACSDEPEPRQDFVETGLQELDINKRGLDAEGETPVIDVRSNTYWMIRTQTQAEWLNFSPTAGSGDVEVVVEAAPNNGAERTAVLVFETQQGEMKRFTVRQSGAESRVTFYEGRFGDGASQLSINRSRRGRIGASAACAASTGVRMPWSTAVHPRRATTELRAATTLPSGVTMPTSCSEASI